MKSEEGMSAADVEMDHNSFQRYDANDPVVAATVATEPTATSGAAAERDASPPVAYWRTRDFQELLVCLSFLIVSLLPTNLIHFTPHQRPIPYQLLQNGGEYVRNLSNDQVLTSETVPDALLLILALVLPFVIQFATGKVRGQKGDAHATACIYLVAFGLTLCTTGLIKVYCGYLRPTFYAVCVPDQNYEFCTESSNAVRMSFPSGHSSTSFTGLTLLTLFFHHRFGLPSLRQRQAMEAVTATTTTTVRGRNDPLRYRLISVLSLAPMGVAVFIASSRVVDNRHFPADVVGGAVLGASIAIFVHGLWL
jgi:membrane-associated phospholipid phosphatase